MLLRHRLTGWEMHASMMKNITKVRYQVASYCASNFSSFLIYHPCQVNTPDIISSVVSLFVTSGDCWLLFFEGWPACVTCSSQWYLKWVYMISDDLLFVYQPACMYSCRLTTQHVEWICLCAAKIVMFSTSISVNHILGVNKTFCRWQKRSVPDHLFMDGALFTNALVSVTRKKKHH